VELVREYEKSYDRDKAVDLAVDECMKRGILTEFFKIYGSEVKYMLYTEQYEAKLRGVWEDYGMERGREEGRDEGIGIGRKEGIGIGRKKGQEEERRKIVSLLKKGVSTDELMKILAARK
jgi:predicted transposase YdaD